MSLNYYNRITHSSQFSSVSDFPNVSIVGNSNVWFPIVCFSYFRIL